MRVDPPNAFMTFGLAATIAGLSGASVEIAREYHEADLKKCEWASELVADDKLNPNLTTKEGRELLVSADRLLKSCFED